MKQTGFVIKTYKNTAVVSVKRKNSCGENCAMCKGSCTAQTVEAKVLNEIGASPGDYVVLEAESKSVIKGAFLLYIMPVLLMIVSYIIADSITDGEAAALISVCALFTGGIIVKLSDKHIAPKTYITEILKGEM